MLVIILILSTLFCVLSFSLVVILLILFLKNQNGTQSLLVSLVREERRESQSLRNQLRSPDVGTLMGLQQATDRDSSSNPVIFPEDDFPLNESPDEGYTLGALSDDDAAAGWTQPIIRKDEDGNYVAYEAT